MSDVIEQAASAIQERLTEITKERRQLESALSSLKGERRGPGRPRGSSNGKKPATRRRRKRAKRGQREAQLTTSIQANPDFKPADHAREIGISPNQIYGLVTKMSEAGTVAKTDDGKLTLTDAK